MSPSNERSAEWLRGAVESHINTCNLITSITSATESHPARQGLMAADVIDVMRLHVLMCDSTAPRSHSALRSLLIAGLLSLNQIRVRIVNLRVFALPGALVAK